MRRQSLVIIAAAAISALAVNLADAAPPPAQEAALRSLISAAAIGRVDEAALTPALAAAFRPQEAIAQKELQALGALKTVAWQRSLPDGSEVYLTTFEHGALEWAFAQTADGHIANAMYRTPRVTP